MKIHPKANVPPPCLARMAPPPQINSAPDPVDAGTHSPRPHVSHTAMAWPPPQQGERGEGPGALARCSSAPQPASTGSLARDPTDPRPLRARIQMLGLTL
eukprot:CAMPEP_0204345444 /NCGR_PEP_ID=MMETSP0469-20131031/26409_1 /ASSEMBLY_ACC=CAM_ASM_000384 /TAXON_ID=2969 /ORGANISM="Oxyrrhis marina" /LENGTH=99 /DNA_ID=CAMNT_0051330885 /DNA_START=45 /DNA_END=342 /DNA_ORIENTATION=+